MARAAAKKTTAKKTARARKTDEQVKSAEGLNALSGREYEKAKFKGADGKTHTTTSNGDALAKAMAGLSVADLNKAVKANGLSEKYPSGVEGFGNQGLARMSIGNSLRALVKNGTPVTVGEHTIKKLDQKVVLPKPETAAA